MLSTAAFRNPLLSRDNDPARAAIIFCVDDEPDLLLALDAFLTSEGFEVLTASSGGEAVVQMRERVPNLIITDYNMTGLELCGRLRASEATRHVPIILYTALRVEADPRLYNRAITKPADLNEFASQIRRLLGASH
jgi:DNA-binding response OmpR family regulator